MHVHVHVLVHMHVHIDDPLPAALRSRAEELKTAVSQLVELLDLNQPSTARLKVLPLLLFCI